MLALLGDFDFRALQGAHGTMGPFFFITFIALAVFVVLNMLIAIISAAYEEAEEEVKQSKEVDLTHVRCARAPTFLGISLIPPPPLPPPPPPSPSPPSPGNVRSGERFRGVWCEYNAPKESTFNTLGRQ
jgi:hypothetical protein